MLRGEQSGLQYRFNQYRIDRSTRELWADGEPVETEPKTFDLLVYLLEHRDRAVSKDEILAAVWPNQIVSDTALTRAIMKARRAVGDDSNAQSVIRTLHGHGYRFVAAVEAVTTTGTPEAEAPAPPAAGPAPRRRPGSLVLVATGIVLVGAIALFMNRGSMIDVGDGTLAVLPVHSEIGEDDAAWVRLGLMSLMSKMLDEGGVDVAPDRLVLSAVGDTVFSMPPDAGQFESLRQKTGADAVLHTTLEFSGGLHRLAAVVTNADGTRSRRVIVGESPAAIAADMAEVISGMITDDIDESRERFSLVSTDPFVNELYARALDLELQGEIVEAREMFRVASAQSPELFWLRYEIALCTRDLEEYDEATRMFDELLVEAESGQDARAVVATLNSYGRMHLTLNQYAEADAMFERATDAAGERSLAEERAVVNINQALVDSWQGDDKAAGAHYEDALAAYVEAGEEPSPFFYNNYAGLLSRLGDIERAREYSESAVEGFQRRGQRRYEAPATNRLATIERRLGNMERSVQLHQKAMAIYGDLDDTKGELSVMSGLTTIYRESGDLTRARLIARDVIERTLAIENYPMGLSNAYIQAAYVEANAREYRAAIELFEQSIEVFESINEQRGIRAARIGIANALIELGDIDGARALGQRMLDDAGDNESTIARAHWINGRAALAEGAFDAANEEFSLALDYARLNGDSLILARAGEGLAEAYLESGDVSKAREHVEEIRPHADADHDFRRLDARIAHAEGELSKALDIMMSLRSEAGEGWTAEDDALLSELRSR